MGLIGSRIWMRRVKGRHDQYTLYMCICIYEYFRELIKYKCQELQ